MRELIARYESIEAGLQQLADFPANAQGRSRALFNLDKIPIMPRHFDVWTCLAGLPVPPTLQARLEAAVLSVRDLLPSGVRTYWVAPRNYHMEIFVVKRPDEKLDELVLQDVASVLDRTFAEMPSIAVVYRGLLVTPDGTVLARGYGHLDALRERLRRSIPIASDRQSTLAHISLGRILDPVGRSAFAMLKMLVARSEPDVFGVLPVHEVKYVHERQWYMMDRRIVGTFRLGSNIRPQP